MRTDQILPTRHFAGVDTLEMRLISAAGSSNSITSSKDGS